jgi:type IV conjugative transfer system lipoprotein TraV
MKKLLLSSSLLSISLLAGCSTPGYECALHTNSAGKCASVESAYKASKEISPSQASQGQSVFDRAARSGPAKAAEPVVGAALSGLPAGDPGMPVYKQPTVVRVWVAPYVDANGNLRSGEYAYFATPGEWNYGTLRNPGQSGMFGPVKPQDYGFNPTTDTKTTAAPPPSTETQSQQAPSAPPVTTLQPGTSSKPASAGITQPYQRL